jgi:phosphoribosyl-ATP pyrophosphohydrolase/phosphoribosyl-AMP cyclohydrolase
MTPTVGSLDWLWRVVEQRVRDRPDGSYVVGLLDAGPDRILRKFGEETAEVIVAAKNRSADELSAEMADLWFHSLLVLKDAGLSPKDVYRTLAARHPSPEA